MKRFFSGIAVLLLFSFAMRGANIDYQNELRAPAYPLVTVDPYFSVWSFTNEAYADMTRHWSGRKQPLLVAVRVDGVTYRVLGNEAQMPDPMYGRKPHKQPENPLYHQQGPVVFEQAAKQLSVNVLPTSTVYEMECGPVNVTMTFTAPLLLDDLDLLSRPVNYLGFKVTPVEKGKHSVQVYVEASPRIAVDIEPVPVNIETGSLDGVKFIRTGTVAQPVLEKKGDDVRIDWGYFYMAPVSGKGSLAIVQTAAARPAFMSSGKVKAFGKQNNIECPNFDSDQIACAWVMDLGKVKKEKEEVLMLAYDDIHSIKYLGQPLDAYWKADPKNTITREMSKAAKGYAKVIERCSEFDKDLVTKATISGGKEYADLCATAYRQAVAAHKLVRSPRGELFFMSKENFSNGCAGTVDVTYPSFPLFLFSNTDIAQAMLNFIFDYAESGNWENVWAPHDVGQYPDAYGQHYGNWMPLEESGNMLIMTAALLKQSTDAGFAQKHWRTLTKWALYTLQNGQNPEKQLCTDDFAGKLAHNVNLSAKSIVAIAAYAKMATSLGKVDEAEAFRAFAESMAKKWKEDAFENDHYRLAFDKEDSWSLKYNLIWDKLLNLNVFDEDIVPTELAYYKGKMNPYGVPLDSRRQYSKTDWQLWVAAMTPDQEGFREFMLPVYKFYNETPDRVPMGDWVNTKEPAFNSMQARSVVGGFFMKLYIDYPLSPVARKK
jgi:hypothetical protein